MGQQVLAAVSDMIFASKISATATQTEANITFVKSLDKLLEQANNIKPQLIILDLNNPRFDPIEAIKQLKSNENLSLIPVIGFLSHVQVELRRQAQSVGCNYTMPRSQFTNCLLEILNGTYLDNHS